MEKKTVRALFFDVDGTLVGYQHHRIDPREIESIRALREKGYKLFIATGRDIHARLEALVIEPLLGYMDGFISSNGQNCFLADGTEISSHPLNESDFVPLRECCEANHIAMLYYFGPDSYVTEITDHVLAFEKHIGINIPPVRPMDPELRSISRLCVYASPEDEARLLKPLMNHTLTARNSDHLIDLIPKGVGKDSGIREVCAWLKIPREETMAFGDGENDISMMHEAGISVAMGNADERVKAAADYVTGTSEEAGITQALKHFGLI